MKKKRPHYRFPNPETKIGNLIKRRRLQMLVHSCIYYELDDSLITDDKWQEWANELSELLQKHPDVYSDRFDQFFQNWDASSGYNLPHRDPWVYDTAEYLVRINTIDSV